MFLIMRSTYSPDGVYCGFMFAIIGVKGIVLSASFSVEFIRGLLLLYSPSRPGTTDLHPLRSSLALITRLFGISSSIVSFYLGISGKNLPASRIRGGTLYLLRYLPFC